MEGRGRGTTEPPFVSVRNLNLSIFPALEKSKLVCLLVERNAASSVCRKTILRKKALAKYKVLSSVICRVPLLSLGDCCAEAMADVRLRGVRPGEARLRHSNVRDRRRGGDGRQQKSDRLFGVLSRDSRCTYIRFNQPPPHSQVATLLCSLIFSISSTRPAPEEKTT